MLLSWRGGGTCVISHMAMECVAYNVYVMLLTFNLSFDFSIAMVPVVKILMYVLIITYYVTCHIMYVNVNVYVCV